MTERKYKTYRLTVGKPLTVTKNFFAPYLPGNPKRYIDLGDFAPKGEGNAYELVALPGTDDNFAINFNIVKKSGKTARGYIEIMNLDDNFTNYVIDNANNNLVVLFDAGYGDDNKPIIHGTVISAQDVWQGTTRKLVLNIKDSDVNIKNARTVRSYSKNTPVPTVVNDLVSDMGLKKGVIEVDPNVPVLKTPVSLSGVTYDIMHQLAAKYKYVFTINNNHACFTPQVKTVKTVVSLITPESGLKGDAQIQRNKKFDSASYQDPNNEKIIFKTQLDGTLLPESAVWLKTRGFDTAVKIKDVTMQGSYPRGSWECDVKGIRCSGGRG